MHLSSVSRSPARLITIFMVFGLTPAVTLFAILWFQGSVVKEAFMTPGRGELGGAE